MSRETKQRNHSLVEKHPILASFLFAIAAMIILSIVASAVNYPIHRFMVSYSVDTGIIGTVCGAAVVMAVYYAWFKPEFKGMIKGGNLQTGFFSLWMIVPYWIISILIGVFTNSVKFSVPTFSIIQTALFAGVMEETVFRGVIVSTLMRQWDDKKKYAAIAFLSGFIFGIAHGANVLKGADPIRTILQVIETIGIGMFFAASYLRSGTILPAIAVHFLTDILALSTNTSVNESGLITGSQISVSVIADFVLSLLLGAIAVMIIRKHAQQIQQTIRQKWETHPEEN